jgi:GNAT superfamily N-acetyltransferase
VPASEIGDDEKRPVRGVFRFHVPRHCSKKEPSMNITRATPADAEHILALTCKAYLKWVAVIGREPKPMLANYDYATRHHIIDLIHVDGVLAALIETIPQSDGLLIENIAVDPDFQGKGLGRRLMAHAEDLARSLGLTEMRLYTNKMFAENLALYLRFGYAIDREEAFMAGIIVHMHKAL